MSPNACVSVSVDTLSTYLATHLSHPVPEHANPTDHALDVVSTDFIQDPTRREQHIVELAEHWRSYEKQHPELRVVHYLRNSSDDHERDLELEANRSGTGSEGHSLRVFINASEQSSSVNPDCNTKSAIGKNSAKRALAQGGGSGVRSPRGLGRITSGITNAGYSLSSSLHESKYGLVKGLRQTWILMERNMINYSRNLLAYGVRLAMYREFFFLLFWSLL